MGYHILAHNSSCLPLDLPNREGFYLYPDRKKSYFTYGLLFSEVLLDEPADGEASDDDGGTSRRIQSDNENDGECP